MLKYYHEQTKTNKQMNKQMLAVQIHFIKLEVKRRTQMPQIIYLELRKE